MPIQVIINGPAFVDAAKIQYFGLAPSFFGVWQLNILIPGNGPPSSNIPVVIRVNDTTATPDRTTRVC